MQFFLLFCDPFILLFQNVILFFQISSSAVFWHFVQFQTMASGNLKQHRAAGCIKCDLAVVVASKGLVWLWQFKAKCFQRFFLLWGNFTIFILTVEHMAFVDVRRSLIQM